MSVLVYVENADGRFKKSAYETLSYAKASAELLGSQVTAVSIGDVEESALKSLGEYGATKVISINATSLKSFNNQAYSALIAQVAEKENAALVVLANSFSGKGLGPRVAVKMAAAYVDGATSLPDLSDNKFVIKKTAFSNKAFAYAELHADKKVISVSPNTFKVQSHPVEVVIENFSPEVEPNLLKTVVKDIMRSSDKVLLPEADVVVSAGRGLKGPENWGMIEELAALLGAATACSKPVSDADWRPHSEHVGQTGIAISPNLYIAIGISGAIQHLAGVSSSKTIVVINNDPEAPFFKIADYGIVGDAFQVVPQLIEEVKKFKAENA